MYYNVLQRSHNGPGPKVSKPGFFLTMTAADFGIQDSLLTAGTLASGLNLVQQSPGMAVLGPMAPTHPHHPRVTLLVWDSPTSPLPPMAPTPAVGAVRTS